MVILKSVSLEETSRRDLQVENEGFSLPLDHASIFLDCPKDLELPSKLIKLS